jgi:ribosome-binding ATPase YchF (GTP1/OBG family)
VIHVEGAPDPLRDAEIVTIEMALADLASLAKRIDKLEREARVNPSSRTEGRGR